MKLYIGGKITGDPDYRMKFWMKEKKLRTLGHTVLNPAVLPDGLEQADYMRICFAMLDSADAAVLLPDYAESRGARLELDWCVKTGKPAVFWMEGMDEEQSTKLLEERLAQLTAQKEAEKHDGNAVLDL